MKLHVPSATLLGCLALSGALGLSINCQTPATHVMVDDGQDCATCHQSEFAQATQPLHVGVISSECAECHSNLRWSPARGSNHSFPLEGAHEAAPCKDCHGSAPARYEGTPDACIDCHADERDAVAQPSHEDFSDDCASCHGTQSFEGASIDHEWPLEGAHADATCAGCHVGEPPVYEGTPTECVDCHADDRDRAENPSHDDFSSDCSSCHDVGAFRPARFEEHEWPLEGAHAGATCASCHGDPPRYEGTPEDCVGCHQDDRDAVVEPPHAGFSDDCSSCHGTVSFDGADFPHENDFPLTGAHREVACTSCHQGEPALFDGTPTACISCHEADRNAVVEPSHADFSDDCSSCHGTTSFDGADFDHDLVFALRGAHQLADCGDCHQGEPAVFSGTARECVGCHRDDYDASPFPGHDAFSTRCQDCHGENAWTPASGGHPENRFSTRGDHSYACNECHNPSLGPNGAGNADCVGCHDGEHTRARMDREHSGIRNYPLGQNVAPNFCLQCHPGGRE